MLKALRVLLPALVLLAAAPEAAFAAADLVVTKVEDADPVTAGADLTYTITVTNNGPDPADDVAWSDTLPAETTFVSLAQPGGWTCSTPAAGSGGTVSCSLNPLAVGSAVFTLVVHVDPSVPPGTEITNLAGASSTTPDPEPENEVGIATTTVDGSADLSVVKVDTPDPVAAGTSLTYTITVKNAGPNYAGSVVLDDPLPADTTFQSLSAAAGWSCSTPAVGAAGNVSCSIASFAPGNPVFTLTVTVGSGVANGTVLTNTAAVTSPTPDKNPGNESANADTTVTNSTVISATKTASGEFTPGGAVTYTVVLTNTSGQDQADNPGAEFTDVLPTQLTLVSATATSGTAVATVATNTVTWNGPIPGGGSVTITINASVGSGIANGTSISNQGSVAYDADGNGTNEASGVTDDPAAGGAGNPTTFVVGGQSAAEIPTLNEVGLALLVLLLALGGAGLLRRRRA
ncbi:MAG TPA: DUF11 domain-containing protein [Thermoanaerobaculia bacterium]|nr:DUF11 domain-containing protein [Thermoanaerobaculia bacterium]